MNKTLKTLALITIGIAIGRVSTNFIKIEYELVD